MKNTTKNSKKSKKVQIAPVSKTRGRKAIPVTFPKNRPFTLKQIADKMKEAGKNITTVSLSNKIKALIASGDYVIQGTKKSDNRGRPFIIYRSVPTVAPKAKKVFKKAAPVIEAIAA
jgi:predicted ArsR family transcriptional regulator